MGNWSILWPNSSDDLLVKDVEGVSIDLVPALMKCRKCGKTIQENPGDEDRWWRVFITRTHDEATCPDCRPDMPKKEEPEISPVVSKMVKTLKHDLRNMGYSEEEVVKFFHAINLEPVP